MIKNTLSDQQKRLIFRSWHRGTREMDLILGSFAEKHLPGYDDARIAEYERLLVNNDPDLYNWYTGRESVPEEENSLVMQDFLRHKVAGQ